MNEREALLRAVCENPDDDTPRLVFADWLQENGDESDQARAEFIRAQIEQTKLKPQSVPWWKCHSRAQKLLTKYKWAWQNEILANPDFACDEFVRGFAEYVAAPSLPWFRDFAKPICERTPLTKLLICRPLNLADLCDVPRVFRLKRLVVSVRFTPLNDARRFLAAVGESGPTILEFEHPIASPEVERLLRKHFGGRLFLSGDDESDGSFEYL